MKIIWLEDEPETIFVIKTEIEKYCSDIEVCQSFSRFSNELEKLTTEKYLIILDIRILFNSEFKTECFEKSFYIDHELEAGFEYYLECLKDRFDDNRIIFLSSKTLKNSQKDGEKYHVLPKQIIEKEDIAQLIERIKNVI